MKQLISFSIDLTKVDKSKIVKGKKGQEYYAMTMQLQDDKDEYGNDCSIIDSQNKMQREAKEPKNYLGNGKIFWTAPIEKPY